MERWMDGEYVQLYVYGIVPVVRFCESSESLYEANFWSMSEIARCRHPIRHADMAVVLTNGIRRELDWCSCRKDTLTLLDIVLCAEALRFLA